MSVTAYNMRKQVEEFIKVAEKASFDAKRAHERIDALPAVEPPAAPQKGERGPQGLPGKDAAPAPKGERGLSGRDGASIVGAPGKDGRDAPQRMELDSLRKEFESLQSKFAALAADQELLSHAFTSHSQKTSDYLAFLQQRSEARIASGNVKK